MDIAVAGSRDPTVATSDRAGSKQDLPRLGIYARFGKRPVSFAMAILALPIALVVFALLLFVYWLSGTLLWPVASSERVGRGGRRFRMLYLITRDGSDRVTRLGAVLRRTGIDRLPQLWNVLRGDMDLVGPEPETVAIEQWAERTIPGYSGRLAIRPGITGLAQLEQGRVGPDPDAYARRLELNRRYLAEASLTTDLWLLWRALWRGLTFRI